MTFSLRPPPSTLSPGSIVWAYLRDSGGPTQDRSVEQQREIIQDYCRQHALTLARVFFDIHKSGGSIVKRSQFNEMIALSAPERDRPAGLLIWNFARFARDLDDAQIYKGILRKRGILVHSITDPIPEGPFANVIETLIHTADEQKKQEAAFGAWRGLHNLVKQGAMPGTPPRGFKREPLTVTSEQGVERQAHRWVPDPDLAPRVRQAFEMRAAGQPLAEINRATRLFGSLNSYATFFKNKIYIGVLEYGSLVIENYCKPIVPKNTWNRVQTRQARYSKKQHLRTDSKEHPRRANSQFILSGVIHCARCQSPLFGHTSPQRKGAPARSYRCTRRVRRRDCDLPSIPAHAIEETVLNEIIAAFQQPDHLVKLVHAQQAQQASASGQFDAQRAQLQTDLAKLRRKIDHLTDAIAERGHSRSMLDKLAKLETDQADLLEEIEKLPGAPSPLPALEPDTLRKHLTALAERLQTRSTDERRQLIHSFVRAIHIDRIQNRLYGTIQILLPPDDLSSTPPPGDPYQPTNNDVPSSHSPVGAPPFTHSIRFEAMYERKPRSK